MSICLKCLQLWFPRPVHGKKHLMNVVFAETRILNNYCNNDYKLTSMTLSKLLYGTVHCVCREDERGAGGGGFLRGP